MTFGTQYPGEYGTRKQRLRVRLWFWPGQIGMQAYRHLDSLETMLTSGSINVVEAKSLIESIREELRRSNHSQQQLIESNEALIKLNRELESRTG